MSLLTRRILDSAATLARAQTRSLHLHLHLGPHLYMHLHVHLHHHFTSTFTFLHRSLNLLEYQAKGLLEDYGVTVQRFKVASSAEEVTSTMNP